MALDDRPSVTSKQVAENPGGLKKAQSDQINWWQLYQRSVKLHSVRNSCIDLQYGLINKRGPKSPYTETNLQKRSNNILKDGLEFVDLFKRFLFVHDYKAAKPSLPAVNMQSGFADKFHDNVGGIDESDPIVDCKQGKALTWIIKNETYERVCS